MKISLILPSYKRPELLNLGLWSLSQQKTSYRLEIIVLNDGIVDSTEEICKKYKNKLHIRYIFTGYKNSSEESKFRSPSFALNIGIKKSKGKIIILSSPEIFHLNNTIDYIVSPLIDNKKILSTPQYISIDNTGKVKDYLSENLTLNLPEDIFLSLESNTPRCRYASKLPFCIGLYKKELIEIGGYDEDFTGWACDDDDIIGRLILNGLTYNYCSARIIHLYHPKQYDKELKMNNREYLHNLGLYKKRKGTIIRNKNKKWGILK